MVGVRVAAWNLEWAGPARQQSARAHLDGLNADVVVTTEDHVRPWSGYPHVVDGGDDWGYRTVPGRRKVIGWSRTPWELVDVDTPGAARGRLVAARTKAEATTYTVVAVCIPWSAAHVSSGRRDRRRWHEHLEFCEVLGGVLEGIGDRGPVIVAGDFNQRVPRSPQPLRVWEALEAALDGFEIVTHRDRTGQPLIDHIACNEHLKVSDVHGWPNVIAGQRLSDHAGVTVDFALA
jgi:endonuclease/exonuclease/phosphatase (EEP) superfamily protein YafD